LEHFYSGLGENWFDYQQLYSFIVSVFPDKSHFIEVGAWKGMSASYMAVEIINSNKDIRFDCVDLWEYADSQNDISEDMYENLYEVFLKNIEPVKHIINPIKDYSVKASNLYEDKSVDFIFLDASHDYENVMNDLNAWFPKVKLGGVLAGHDYASEGVKKAVNEFFTKMGVVLPFGSCWIYKKV
jgi:predicted O-methyltransferase YrrM